YLSDHGIFSSIIRVPITFPPEKLRGVLLSAMCVPDLRGTQGMFSYYTTRPLSEADRIGGEVHRVERQGDTIRAHLVGPENPSLNERRVLKAPFTVTLGSDRVVLRMDGEKRDLRRGEYTDWLTVPFRVAPGLTITGRCKFLLLESGPEFGLYATPINIDPESPVMPISSPGAYSVYLTK